AASVKARLLAQAKASGEEFERTLVRYAAERLLYRLGVSGARDRCLLKGAGLLAVWLRDPYRTTRDIDLLAFGPSGEQAARGLIEEILSVTCPEDGLRFDVPRVAIEPIRAHAEYVGQRVRLMAYLERTEVLLQVDIGIGDSVGPPTEEIEFPVMLPDLPVPRLRAYPREASVAEKFEAMVTLGARNSRMKDFHDIWALSGAFAFEGSRLRLAVAKCFGRRDVPSDAETPLALTADFYARSEAQKGWRAYVAAGSVLISPPEDFAEIGKRIIAFLRPVQEAMWAGDPFTRHWPPGGPWQPLAPGEAGDQRDG
ncbi:MAG: nucleotidyl transferase AbiEii/AbiGii toxin family protein, partial [Candidatus Eisenbacteria bacterium]|nr:nucleotidyl transferase AbiEii/AbiGii toxin family protein [Candidatus Eisenbacteria bacterium]